MLDALRQMPYLDNLKDEDLQQIWDLGTEVRLHAGDILFREGDMPTVLYVLIEGRVEITKRIGGQEVVLSQQQPVTLVGEIAMMTNSPHTTTVRVLEESRFLHYKVAPFQDETCDTSDPSVGIQRTVIATMVEHLRSIEVQVQQHEKLLALGKLAAGLAHELNNPAAAASRAAKQVREPLNVLIGLALKLGQLNLSPGQVQYLQKFQTTLIERATQPQVFDSLAQSDLEEQLAAWIEEQGVPEGWKLAPMLVAAGLDMAELENLKAQVGAAVLGDVLAWLEGILTVTSLFRLLDSSTTRIFTLVNAFKAYSYMDQSPLQEIDIHEGLENTLLILGYQLKDVIVTRQYDHSVPRITAYGSELNQVWTNLIDNAIDAMNGRGQLWIRTSREQNYVQVEIADNGPGIPPETQSHIFEPFFTTKPVGKGIGLGLDTAYRIVVERHHGTIRFSSKPGGTRFQVCLPIGQS